MATDYGLGGRGSISDSCMQFFSTSQGPDRLWGQMVPEPIPQGNMAGVDACSSSSYLAGIGNGWLISPFPHTPSWRAAEWNTRRNELNPYLNLQNIEC
jgi:hypothetical protein